MNGLTTLGVFMSMFLHIADQASDVFVAFLFYFEGQTVLAGVTLGFVFLPGLLIGFSELRKMCGGPVTSVAKSFFFAIFSPMWAIFLHLISLFDQKHARMAFFFKNVEGFVEAGPQLVLQLALFFHGSLTHSSHMVLEPVISTFLEKNISLASDQPGLTTTVGPGSLDAFGRVYDPEIRYWFGCIHVISILISFLSILFSAVSFNDLENTGEDDRGCLPMTKSRFCGRICCGVPFFFLTLFYRSIILALAICYLQIWAGVILFMIFFGNVLTALYSGDNFKRSIVYATWSFLIPAGYNWNPSFPLGYSKVSMRELPPDDKEIEHLRHRAKYYLSAHVLSNIFIFGGSFVVTIILVTVDPDFYELNTQSIFNIKDLPVVFLPLLGLCLALIVLLVRPYHRCDCSGGETPSGNIIV